MNKNKDIITQKIQEYKTEAAKARTNLLNKIRRYLKSHFKELEFKQMGNFPYIKFYVKGTRIYLAFHSMNSKDIYFHVFIEDNINANSSIGQASNLNDLIQLLAKNNYE